MNGSGKWRAKSVRDDLSDTLHELDREVESFPEDEPVTGTVAKSEPPPKSGFAHSVAYSVATVMKALPTTIAQLLGLALILAFLAFVVAKVGKFW